MSGSPDLKAIELATSDADPEVLAKEDPLALQVWKMYARNKVALPHAKRMENLTWRMMYLGLTKKREEEEVRAAGRVVERQGPLKQEPSSSTDLPPSLSREPHRDDNSERGRGRDKAPFRVAGFDGINQDGPEDEDEYVIFHSCVIWHHIKL